tara:strand:+ start:37198 stop:38010 length:813 start_codon:yes stop_codon:yes gene_type:complete
MRFVAESEHGRWGNTKYASAAELKLMTSLNGPRDSNISQLGWSLHAVDSESGNDSATNAFDGNINTKWHTPWGPDETQHPHEIAFDLGASYDITELSYLPRQDNSTNGTIAQYEIYVSTDGIDWGTPVSTGTWVNSKSEKSAKFDAKTGRYIKLVSLSEVAGKVYASAAEINVYGKASGQLSVTDIDLLGNENKITIYPNPSNSDFYIKMKNFETSNISIYDMSGKMLNHVTTDQEVFKVSNESILQSGLYIIKVVDETRKSHYKKLIIE